MNPIELLHLTSNTSTVAFHKFVLLSTGRQNDIFCFSEGWDSQYYSLRVKNIVTRTYHPIHCGNKKTVLDTYRRFASSKDYDSYVKVFFVDRDYDASVGIEDIYETPCYSIENLYTNEHTLKEVLKNEFGLTEADKEYKEIIKMFRKELEKFNKVVLLFNAWYAALKKKKEELKVNSTNVCLEDKLPKNFITLKIGSIESHYNFEMIQKAFPQALKVSTEEVQQAIEELSKGQISCKLRGKYQMWFFYTFLKFLIDDANKEKKILRKKTKFKIDRALIHSQLSQYALTPTCLVHYLSQRN